MGLATYAAAESYMGQPGTARVPYPPGYVPPPAAANLPPAAATVQRSSPANPNEPSPWRESQRRRKLAESQPEPPWKESLKRDAAVVATEWERIQRRLIEPEPDNTPSNYAEELIAKSRKQKGRTLRPRKHHGANRTNVWRTLGDLPRSTTEHQGAPKRMRSSSRKLPQSSIVENPIG